MEAIAKHDFVASARDELSFSRGNILRVLNMEDDENWFRAELGGREGLIPGNYIELRNSHWYYSRLSRSSAETLLAGKPEGTFLVRFSESFPGDFSVSVRMEENGTEHFRVLRDPNGKYFLWASKFHSLNELITYHYTSSLSFKKHVKLKDLFLDEVLLRALYDFCPREKDELGLRKGDILILRDRSDENWWSGDLGERSGIFPAKYVVPFKP